MQPIPVENSTIQWYDMAGNPVPPTPIYNTDSIRHYQWQVNQKVKVCESVYDTLDIRIHPHPTVKIETKGGHACIGDEILLIATGAARYEWQPAHKIEYRDSNAYASVYDPETFTVTGYSTVGCTGTHTLIFDNIEKCCLFSYPNAFTPNADGINDGWHPITYGNVDQYQLSIYNRWGERVYISRDPQQRWDGRHGGILCDIGTYHYRLKAHCITGSTEESAGSFLLLK